MREFPLARVECPYSSSGCCDEQQSPTPAMRNGGSDHFLGADEDEKTLQEQQEDTEDASMWKMRDLAAKQQAAGNGLRICVFFESLYIVSSLVRIRMIFHLHTELRVCVHV